MKKIMISQPMANKTYVTHELTHIKEYLYSIDKNTVNGILNKEKAFDEISRSVYAKEILKDALKACNLDYNRGTIGKNISLYGTYNSSEAIAEAISNSTSNDLCDKIKELYKKKWK